MRKIIFLLLCFISFSLGATILQTTANSLNVREVPNGKVIDTLPKGSYSALITIKKDWAKSFLFEKK